MDQESVDRESIMAGMDRALEKVNQRRWWIWGVFLLCSSPGMFNAWHIMVSNFYAFVPPHWCKVPELEEANWTTEQIRKVSSPGGTDSSSCSVICWNYTQLVALGYEGAVKFISTNPTPADHPCTHFVYEEKVPYSTTVSQWNLVCDNQMGKTHVQGSIAIGKFFGGFLFGFIADKYGRKVSFILACFTYIVFGPLAALSPSFWFFVAARFLIGVAGSGCYESGFTILAEVVNKERRAVVGCLYNLSYPVGYMTLPVVALLFTHWRSLQLAISLPSIVLLFHCWILPESPRWLLTQGRREKAWKIISRIDQSLVPETMDDNVQVEVLDTASLFSRIIGGSLKLCLLFSSAELCKIIAVVYFVWFVAALSYYVLALNAVNFNSNQHLFTFLSGLVEVPGYTMPLLMLLWMGRKTTSAILFFISGSALVSITGIPRDYSTVILAVALLGRFTDVAVFGVIIFYTSELFPTTVRNTAIGSCLAVSQFGSIYAPYIVDNLSKYGWYLPSTLCGCVALLAAALVLLLPETRDRPLLDTIEQLKQRKDRVSFRNCCSCS